MRWTVVRTCKTDGEFSANSERAVSQLHRPDWERALILPRGKIRKGNDCEMGADRAKLYPYFSAFSVRNMEIWAPKIPAVAFYKSEQS
jgi:hypothetical protein